MNMQSEIEEDVSPNMLGALPAILWQRRWLFVPPIILCSAGGIAAAFLLAPQYQSSATVLIESAQLQTDMTTGPSSEAIAERIARARERVLSRQDMIRAIRANALYPREQQQGQPLSTIVDKMRLATSIDAAGVDDGSGMRAAMQGRNTIALRIAFKYEDPTKAQIVAQQFVNRFLELDAAAAADTAKGAERFLSDQSADNQNKLHAIEAQVTRIKAENGSLLTLGQQSTGDPAADAARIDGEIAAAVAQQGVLNAANSSTGGDGNVATLQSSLADLQARYSDTHPDVIAAKARLEAARRAGIGSGVANAQLAANRAQIAALRSARAMLMSSSSSAKAAAARAPAVAGMVDQLEKQAQTLREQSAMISGRLQQAQIASKMEVEQKGERLTLADPPIVPDKPFWPNRPMLIAASLAAGAGIGFGLVILIELLLRPIRGVEALRSATGVPPLVLVPDYGRKPNFLIRWLERRNRRRASKAS